MTEAVKYYWQRLAPFIGVYIFFELIVLMAVFAYTKYKHEKLCRKLTEKIEQGYEFN